MSSAQGQSSKFFGMQIAEIKKKHIKAVIRILLFSGIFIFISAAVYSKFQSFIEAGGFWAFYCALCVTYPPLSYLVFLNPITPSMCLYMFYYCQQAGNCPDGGIGSWFTYMIFDPTSNTPWESTPSTMYPNTMQICENNLSITSFSGETNGLVYSTEFQEGIGQEFSFSGNQPSSPNLSEIISYGIPFLMLVGMLFL